MNIGKASQLTGLSVKTIRFYEENEFVKPERAANGYRDYSDHDIQRLAFVQRARSLGFGIRECSALLSLYDDQERTSAEVRALALEKIGEIDRKIQELKTLRDTLQTLATHCHGDDSPECPIIEELAKGTLQ